MVGAEERVFDDFADVVVGEAIVDEVPVAAAHDDAGEAELGEVLRDGRRRLVDPGGDLVHAQLGLAQRPHDAEPCAVGEQREGLDREVQLAVIRSRENLAICASTETVASLWVVSDGPIIEVRYHWLPAGDDAAAAVGATVCFVVGVVLDLWVADAGWARAVFLLGVVAGGWRPALDGLRALRDKRLDVDLLMVIAAGAAIATGQWRDAALLIVIFATSGALEAAATARTTAGVRSLLIDSPDQAELLVGDVPTPVAVGLLAVGDRVLVRQGARVPVDGVVVEGEAAVDESSLTGEPLPARKIAGRSVLAGTSLVEGALIVEVGATAGDSVLARLADAVAEAVEQRPPTQLFVARFEQRYAVGVVAASIVLAVLGPAWFGWSSGETLERTMTFLVVASPCAVVLATMPATLSALAAAARHRVLIRGGAVLERLAGVDVVAFDKTGTLTAGTPRVTNVEAVRGGERSCDELLALAASAERWSEHPIGRAIVAEADRRELALLPTTDTEIIASRGVRATVADSAVRVGGPALLGDLGAPSAHGTVVGVEINGLLTGLITLEDCVRDEAPCAVVCLARAGVQRTVLLTGDQAAHATAVASVVGIGIVAHDLLPEAKALRVRELRDAGRQVVYVGDGINDTTALATASVGVSLGQRGTALAIDAADVVLMDDDLHHLPDMIELARSTRAVVRANLAFSLAVIAGLVTLDLFGRLPLIVGVVGHEGSSVIVALNGLRLLRWRPPSHPLT